MLTVVLCVLSLNINIDFAFAGGHYCSGTVRQGIAMQCGVDTSGSANASDDQEVRMRLMIACPDIGCVLR